MLAYTFNPSTQGTVRRTALYLGPPWAAWQDPGQPELNMKILMQINEKNLSFMSSTDGAEAFVHVEVKGKLCFHYCSLSSVSS